MLLVLITGAFIVSGIFYWTKLRKKPTCSESGFDIDFRAEESKRRADESREWMNEFIRTYREAWASSFGTSFEVVSKYMKELEDYQMLCSALARYSQYKDSPCSDERETYTHKTFDGSVVSTFTSRCDCSRCSYDETLRAVEVKKDILGILETQIPNLISPIDNPEKIQELVSSWRDTKTTTRGQLSI